MIRAMVALLLTMSAPTSALPSADTGVSVGPCQVAFQLALASNSQTNVSRLVVQVIESYILSQHFNEADAHAQRMLCQAYFQGQHDLLAEALPSA